MTISVTPTSRQVCVDLSYVSNLSMTLMLVSSLFYKNEFLLSDSDDEKQASKESSDRNGKSKGAAPNPEFWSKVNQDGPFNSQNYKGKVRNKSLAVVEININTKLLKSLTCAPVG